MICSVQNKDIAIVIVCVALRLKSIMISYRGRQLFWSILMPIKSSLKQASDIKTNTSMTIRMIRMGVDE